MRIIVGLGNPGKQYERTRHNTGFLALDFFISDFGFRISDFKNNFDSLILDVKIDNEKIILAKPQTFMNESGKAVKQVCDFYKIDVSKDLLIIHDDSDLPLGTTKTTDSSSSAGHNGVQNTIDKLGTQDFHRVRIGIESREDKNIPPTEAFVLQNFSDDELKRLQKEIFPKVKLEIEKFLKIVSLREILRRGKN